MSNSDPLAAEVLVSAEVSAEVEQAIVEAFRALDVAVRIRMIPARCGLEQLHWLVLAVVRLPQWTRIRRRSGSKGRVLVPRAVPR